MKRFCCSKGAILGENFYGGEPKERFEAPERFDTVCFAEHSKCLVVRDTGDLIGMRQDKAQTICKGESAGKLPGFDEILGGRIGENDAEFRAFVFVELSDLPEDLKRSSDWSDV